MSRVLESLSSRSHGSEARVDDRRIIINGDDFGLSSAVNDGIVLAYREGVLRSASLMMGEATVEEAVSLARRNPGLAVGLHIALSDAHPVLPPAQIPDLVQSDGRFHPDESRIAKRLLYSRETRRQLRAEIAAQFAAFRRTGLRCDHVNSHRNAHLHPVIALAVFQAAVKEQVSAVRIPWQPGMGDIVWHQRSSMLINLIRCLRNTALRGLATLYGLRTPDRAIDVTGRRASLPRFLKRLPSGTTELYMHPATAAVFSGCQPGFPYLEDLATLCDPAIQRAVAGVPICSYSEALPRRAQIPPMPGPIGRRGTRLLRRTGVFLFLMCCAAGLSSASLDACTLDKPPCRAPQGVLSFAEEFRSLDWHRWMTTYPWGGRNLAGPGGQGELQEYIDPGYKRLGLNPFSIEHDDSRSLASNNRAPPIDGAGAARPGAGRYGDAVSKQHLPARDGDAANGILSIHADRVKPALMQQLDGKAYSSGLLTTFHSFSQTYGYFEMRARLPYGRGLWPAFWLLPIDRSWPPEIDVMEELGDRPTTLYVTVHGRGLGGADRPTGFEPRVADMSAGFHRYGVLWTAKFLAWYFDGQRVAFTRTPPELNRPMYLLVNLAVGGKWAGAPDAATRFPAKMEIDYIRAYHVAP